MIRKSAIGIREIDAHLNSKGFLQFKVNRRNFWSAAQAGLQTLFGREPRLRLAQEMQYLNT